MIQPQGSPVTLRFGIAVSILEESRVDGEAIGWTALQSALVAKHNIIRSTVRDSHTLFACGVEAVVDEIIVSEWEHDLNQIDVVFICRNDGIQQRLQQVWDWLANDKLLRHPEARRWKAAFDRAKMLGKLRFETPADFDESELIERLQRAARGARKL